jgi:hypothetical protein
MTKRSLTLALFGEVGQTERSAIRHPRVEARRLGLSPPASALRAVADHAERAEPSFRALAEARGMARRSVGTAIGTLFSVGRDGLADFFLTTEQSYRGTLLGLRHGYDVVSVLRMAARVEHDIEVANWSDVWLAERAPLLDAIAGQMRWFVDRPALALSSAKSPARAAG